MLQKAFHRPHRSLGLSIGLRIVRATGEMREAIGLSKLFHLVGVILWPVIAHNGGWNAVAREDSLQGSYDTCRGCGVEFLDFHISRV